MKKIHLNNRGKYTVANNRLTSIQKGSVAGQ